MVSSDHSRRIYTHHTPKITDDNNILLVKMNECIKGWMNYEINQLIHKWMTEWINERINEWMTECIDESMNDMNELIYQLIN